MVSVWVTFFLSKWAQFEWIRIHNQPTCYLENPISSHSFSYHLIFQKNSSPSFSQFWSRSCAKAAQKPSSIAKIIFLYVSWAKPSSLFPFRICFASQFWPNFVWGHGLTISFLFLIVNSLSSCCVLVLYCWSSFCWVNLCPGKGRYGF